MASKDIEVTPIYVDENLSNIENNLITPSTQTFYAHKATNDEYGVVKLSQISDAVNEHNEDENAHPQIQEKLTKIEPLITEHIENKNNPHEVTKEQLGLDKVENVSITESLATKVDAKVVTDKFLGVVSNTADNSSVSVGLAAFSKNLSKYAGVGVEIGDNDAPNLSVLKMDGDTQSFVNLTENGVEVGSTARVDVKAEEDITLKSSQINIITDSDDDFKINGKTLPDIDSKVDKEAVTDDATTTVFNEEGMVGVGAIGTSKNSTQIVVTPDGASIYSQNPKENKFNQLSVTPDKIGVVKTGSTIIENLATEGYVDNRIEELTSVQIRNKTEITATQNTIQTVATNYILDNYGRQPENFDGLIITLTDLNNDKILYIYSETSGIWINAGINSVDLSNYVTIDKAETITGDKNFEGSLLKNGDEVATTKEAQKTILIGADGVEETQVYSFTVKDFASYLSYRTTGTKFLVDLYLPVAGDLTLDKKVAITFGDTTYYVYNILKGGEPITIGDLHQVDKYDNSTGYRFITEMLFFETSDLTGFYIIPTVSMSDVLSLTSDQMDNYMADGGLTQGQLAICSRVITNGYVEGGLYRYDITYGETNTYTWTELSGNSSGLRILDLSNGFSAEQQEIMKNDYLNCLVLKDKVLYYFNSYNSSIGSFFGYRLDKDVTTYQYVPTLYLGFIYYQLYLDEKGSIFSQLMTQSDSFLSFNTNQMKRLDLSSTEASIVGVLDETDSVVTSGTQIHKGLTIRRHS